MFLIPCALLGDGKGAIWMVNVYAVALQERFISNMKLEASFWGDLRKT